jgi:hypothetical protein
MTTPTGKLAYGQAGSYDAIDDRAVIRALSNDRTGLVGATEVAAGSGLYVTVAGGWLGVADCGDRTTAVIGSQAASVVEASPGPPTGTREDVIWVDVDPDEGNWAVSVIPASAAAGRPGLAVGSITVPANATLASQMTIRPGEATLERRLWYAEFTETNVRSGSTWDSVGNQAWVQVTCEPGRLYRVRFTCTSPMALTSQYHPPGGRIGVGMRPVGADDAASQMLRAGVIAWPIVNAAQHAQVEHIFRHPPNAAPIARWFDGRVWIAGVGTFRVAAVTAQGPPIVISVEDMGT